mmetsp:Transcript_114672/g.320440  ORF Transcript_114672/g.320440 Transcript_114672/m.320440 type:complete len:285 (-) Transcript_114672:105-959(-)
MYLVVLRTRAEQRDPADQLHHVDDVVVVPVEEVEHGVLHRLFRRLDAVGLEELGVGLDKLLAGKLPLRGRGLQSAEAVPNRHVLQTARLPQLLEVLQLRIVLVLGLVCPLCVAGAGQRMRPRRGSAWRRLRARHLHGPHHLRAARCDRRGRDADDGRGQRRRAGLHRGGRLPHHRRGPRRRDRGRGRLPRGDHHDAGRPGRRLGSRRGDVLRRLRDRGWRRRSHRCRRPGSDRDGGRGRRRDIPRRGGDHLPGRRKRRLDRRHWPRHRGGGDCRRGRRRGRLHR